MEGGSNDSLVFRYPQRSFPPGSELDPVRVSFVRDYGQEFGVFSYPMMVELREIEKRLKRHYSAPCSDLGSLAKHNTGDNVSFVVGQGCVVELKKAFYRAEIIKEQYPEGTEAAMVRLVDFGVNAPIVYKNRFPVVEDVILRLTPNCNFTCRLYGQKIIRMMRHKSINCFVWAQVQNKEDPMSLKVINCDVDLKNKLVHNVEFRNSETSLVQILINMKISRPYFQQRHADSAQMTAFSSAKLYFYFESLGSAAEAVSYYKLDALDKPLVIPAVKGDLIGACVSYVNYRNQLVSKTIAYDKFRLYVAFENDLAAKWRLFKEMDAHYRSSGDQYVPRCDAKIGKVYAVPAFVQSERDPFVVVGGGRAGRAVSAAIRIHYYRALIISRLSDTELEVFHIDTGVMDKCDGNKVRLLTEHFRKVPPLTVPVKLADFKPDKAPKDAAETVAGLIPRIEGTKELLSCSKQLADSRTGKVTLEIVDKSEADKCLMVRMWFLYSLDWKYYECGALLNGGWKNVPKMLPPKGDFNKVDWDQQDRKKFEKFYEKHLTGIWRKQIEKEQVSGWAEAFELQQLMDNGETGETHEKLAGFDLYGPPKPPKAWYEHLIPEHLRYAATKGRFPQGGRGRGRGRPTHQPKPICCFICEAVSDHVTVDCTSI